MGRIRQKIQCVVCSKEVLSFGKKYCSVVCRVKDPNWKASVAKTTFKKGIVPKNKGGGFISCLTCGKAAWAETRMFKNGTKKFCSVECSNEAKVGTPAWNKGLTGFKKAENGFSFSSGEAHLGWKGGSINYVKRQAKLRDNYTCQVCGLMDLEVMEVDHIRPKAIAPELYTELSNLMTLCANCHRRKTFRERKNKIYGR